jgi:hypothetical protein
MRRKPLPAPPAPAVLPVHLALPAFPAPPALAPPQAAQLTLPRLVPPAPVLRALPAPPALSRPARLAPPAPRAPAAPPRRTRLPRGLLPPVPRVPRGLAALPRPVPRALRMMPMLSKMVWVGWWAGRDEACMRDNRVLFGSGGFECRVGRHVTSLLTFVLSCLFRSIPYCTAQRVFEMSPWSRSLFLYVECFDLKYE